LDVLRYMGQQGITAAEIGAMVEGTGKSERSIRKSIRPLVTKGYMSMDENYIYFLTDKGARAVEELAELDAEGGTDMAEDSGTDTATAELVIVGTAPIPPAQSMLQFGLASPPQLDEESSLILRLSTSDGQIADPELTLKLAPGAVPEPVSTTLAPSGTVNKVRVRVEAIQMLSMADAVPVGGLFVDIDVAPQPGQAQAWYGGIYLQA
ncbi:MAG: hypothetical protein ACLFTK_01195, partial [Anaerolineales bacterium]